MSKEFKFKNSGTSIEKEVENLNFAVNSEVSNFPFGIKTPLSPGTLNKETLFKMNFSLLDQLDDNLKNLLLTRKGERLGFADYGTNLKKIYALSDKEQIEEIAIAETRSTIEKYMPFINLLEYSSDKEVSGEDAEVIYKIIITYSIPTLNNDRRSITLRLKNSG